MSLYSFLWVLLSGIVRVCRGVKISGKENLEVGHSYLVCSNHIAFDDPVLIAAVLPCEPKFMAKKEIMVVPVLGSFLRLLGAFPIDREGNDVGAIKKSINFLKEGNSLIMFPQGKRSGGRLPSTTTPKSGCGMIATKAECDVLPILLEMKNYKRIPFRRTYLKIGKPISAAEIKECQSYDESSALIFSRITAMENPALMSSAEVKKLEK